jgi:hypothetical protein
MTNRYQFASKVCFSISLAMAWLILFCLQSNANYRLMPIFCVPEGPPGAQYCDYESICLNNPGVPCQKFYDPFTDDCFCDCRYLLPPDDCLL